MEPTQNSQPQKFRSLRKTLTTVFLFLTVFILLIATSLETYFNYQAQQKVIKNQEELVAQEAAAVVNNFVKEKTRVLAQSSDINDLATKAENRHIVSEKLLGRNPEMRQLFILDKNASELEHVSRLSKISGGDPVSLFREELMKVTLSGRVFVSTTYIDTTTNEPLMLIAVPTNNLFRESIGAFVAEINLKFIWDLVGGLRIGDNGSAYVVDGVGRLIAYKDISRVLLGENERALLPVAQFIYGSANANRPISTSRGIDGQNVVATAVSLDSPNWAVIVELPVSEAYAGVIKLLKLSFLILLFSSLVSIILGYYISKVITDPLVRLTKIAEVIISGNFSLRAEMHTSDEVGKLAQTFNQMLDKIAAYNKELEEKVKELLEEHSRFIASINSLKLGFIAVDKLGNIIAINPATKNLFDFKDEEVTLPRIFKKMGPNIDLLDYFKQTVSDGRSFDLKDIVYEAKTLKLFVAPITFYLTTKEFIGAVILIEDVTEEKIIERSRDEFFSIASHELRTPLTAIRGNASMLMDYYADKMNDPDMKQMIDDMLVSSERLIRIVNDFLSVSRLEQKKMEFRNVPLNIAPIIEGTLKELELNASKAAIALKLVGGKKRLPLVLADQDRLKQVLMNLIGNAINHSTGGSVSVSTQVEEKVVRVIIKDTGLGIAPENQALLFRKFQQAGSSIISRDVTGTGLGLYISKLLVEGMGGEIALVKSAVGKGSTFSFTLPISGEVIAEGASEK